MTEFDPDQTPAAPQFQEGGALPQAPQAAYGQALGQPVPQQYGHAPAPQQTHQMPFQVYPQSQPQFVVQRIPKSRVAAGLFGIFLGGLGIHRFYLGYTAIGLIQLLACLILGIFTFEIAGIAIGIWGLVEGIMILSRADYFRTDAHGIPLRD